MTRCQFALWVRVAVLAVVAVIIGGCGGGSGGTSSNVLVSGLTFNISWPARTRDVLAGPQSAQSVAITLVGASAQGTDVVVDIDRTATIAYSGTYSVPVPVKQSATKLQAKFYAQAGEQGAVVATATADIEVLSSIATQNPTLGLFSLSVGQSVKSIQLDPSTALLVVGSPQQLAFTAFDSSGAIVAISPGSATFSITSGQSNMSLSADGIATPLATGMATIAATVDGIASPPLSITIVKNGVTINDITPSIAETASVFSMDGDVQVGAIQPEGEGADVGVMWQGTVASMTRMPLSPGQTQAYVGVVSGNLILGGVRVQGAPGVQAAIWDTSGGTATPTLLAPAPQTALGSTPTAISGSTIYGTFDNHACLWAGSSHTFQDITPAGAIQSSIVGAAGNLQAGGVDFANEPGHAAEWSGTAQSFVDLNPAGYEASEATDTDGTYVVGWVLPAGGGTHAAVWQTTAASFRDLNPVGETNSLIRAIGGGYAVGYCSEEPAIWNVSTGHVLRLIDFLKPNYEANEVINLAFDSQGNAILLVNARTTNGMSPHALLVTLPKTMLP